MNQVKFMENVGKVATVTAVAMYVSYFPQILLDSYILQN